MNIIVSKGYRVRNFLQLICINTPLSLFLLPLSYFLLFFLSSIFFHFLSIPHFNYLLYRLFSALFLSILLLIFLSLLFFASLFPSSPLTRSFFFFFLFLPSPFFHSFTSPSPFPHSLFFVPFPLFPPTFLSSSSHHLLFLHLCLSLCSFFSYLSLPFP